MLMVEIGSIGISVVTGIAIAAELWRKREWGESGMGTGMNGKKITCRNLAGRDGGCAGLGNLYVLFAILALLLR